MRASTVSATLLLALLANVHAAPATVGSTATSILTKRQTEEINDLIVRMNMHTAKRGLITDPVELQAREYAIVTQILAAINSTNLAPQIILGLIGNEKLQPIVTSAVEAIIKSGIISLDTLFTALNDSGLATRVIQDLINDCTFYQDIFKLALQEIDNLVEKIEEKLAGNSVSVKRFEEETEFPQEQERGLSISEETKRLDANEIVDNLLESLANSGLASSVVRALIVDPQFLEYGASLLKQLFQDDLIEFSSLISALIDSGLVTSLFKEFFNVSTLKTVIFNALAAAFNNCGGSTISGTPTGLTTQSTTTTTLPSFTATGTATPSGTATACRKRRKRRSYNY